LTYHGKKESFRENSFWLALELDEAIENLSGLSFYLDIPGVREKEECLNLWFYTRWSVKGENLPMTGGLFSTGREYAGHTLELFYEYDYSNRINRSLKAEYDARFLTLKDDFNPQSKRELIPEKLKDAFPPTVAENFNIPLLWIEVICPPSFTTGIMDALRVSINAFPAVNKQLVTRTMEINRMIPLIPLPTGKNESFISVHSLTDADGKHYYDIPVNDSEQTDCGLYSLYRGGLERYNERDAGEYLETLVDSITGEVSAFFNNRDNLKNDLKKIEQDVNEVVKHLNREVYKKKEHYEVAHYLHVHQEPECAVYFVKYWISRGMDASLLEEGSLLHPGSALSLGQAEVISPVIPSRPAPPVAERNKRCQRALSSHTLLVTGDDIRHFCTEKFGHLIRNVRISRGLMEDSNPAIGFIRTTDVYLRVKEELKSCFGQDKKDFIEQALKENSPATFYIRVFVEN
jgi:hypothetical protein